jgi:hypothetical protein
MGEVTHSVCLTKKIYFHIFVSLLIFMPIFACRKLLVRCNVRISNLYCVVGLIFSGITDCGIRVSLTPQRHSVVYRH